MVVTVTAASSNESVLDAGTKPAVIFITKAHAANRPPVCKAIITRACFFKFVFCGGQASADLTIAAKAKRRYDTVNSRGVYGVT